MTGNYFFFLDGSSIDVDDLEGKQGASGEIGTSNIGNKLLRMMGWSGGGLGKGGSGISEPITATAIMNREGFGSKNAGREFKQKIKKIVEEYAASTNPYDLVFTAGFDNEQRKEMHT